MAPENRLHLTTLLPGAGLALLSKFTCSLCLAAYGTALSSIGLGSLVTDAGLTVLTAILLSLGLASVVWSTLRHHHKGPLMTVIAGSAVLLASRLINPSQVILLAGALLIMAGSVWNLRLERRGLGCCARPVADGDTHSNR